MNNSNDTDLGHLETQLDELIRMCDELKGENALLRERQTSLVEERARLIEKTELARTKVESMISRLRAMETEA